MNDDERREWRMLLFLIALLLAIWVAGNFVTPVYPAPVEQIIARCRVHSDGQGGLLTVGGTVDSIRYFAHAPMCARRDSAQLWIFSDGNTWWPDGETAPRAFLPLDSTGAGRLQWSGRVDAFGFWRDTVTIDGDRKRIGQAQPPLFRDDNAFVEARYAGFTMTDLTAWGSEVLLVPVAAGSDTGRDVGQDMVQSPVNPAQLYFNGGLREGGGRYLVRTLATWASGGARWLRLELTRDSTAFQALVP